jgi:hypothetical protein
LKTGQRVVQASACTKRKQRVALEICRRFAGGVERGRHRLGIGVRRELGQPVRAERRQREAGDDLDDAIEFERTEGQHQKI